MRKLIVLGGVAVVMFTASSLISYWLTQSRTLADNPTQPAAVTRLQPAAPKAEPAASPGLPPAVRPPFNPGAEELLRLRTQISDSQQRLQTEEKRLATR